MRWRWISQAAVVAIHDRHLAEHGGATGLRDAQLLESALARPQQTAAYQDGADLAALAAALAYGLARNHPFVDGNKRTAWVSCRTFMALNNGDFREAPQQKFSMMLGLAEGSISEQDFALWLRRGLRQDESSGIHEPTAHYSADQSKA